MSARERLDAIAARLEGATPGPWEVSPRGGGVVADLPEREEPHRWRGGIDHEGKRERVTVAKIPHWEGAHEPIRPGWARADAELIAHAPTDLAAMHAALTVVLDLYDRTCQATVGGCSDDLEEFLADLRNGIEDVLQPKGDRS